MTEKKKIYIDIQSLLDVRQSALVILMGQEPGLKYVNTEEYYLRVSDDFPVQDDLYNLLLNDISGAVLSHATVTYMVVILSNRLDQIEKLNVFDNDVSQTELVVNTFPYRLTENTATSFRDALFTKLTTPVVISLIYEPLSTLTPTFIKHSGICQFYCYEAAQWLKLHSEQILSGSLRDVRLFFPSLGKTQLTEAESKDILKIGFSDVFAYTEFIFSKFVKMQFLPTMFYSNLISATVLVNSFNEELLKKPLTEDQENKEQNGDLINTN